MKAARVILKLSAGCILAMCCVSCGPHMKVQPSIKPYERQMPKMPKGTVPISGNLSTIALTQSKAVKNPLPATKANISDGRIYYGYYCLMCHGKYGDGNGPVGQSYRWKPTNLSSARVTGMTDGQLYYAMLHGRGHDPVMEQTVLPGQRWPLVLYVRTFSKH